MAERTVGLEFGQDKKASVTPIHPSDLIDSLDTYCIDRIV